MPDAHFGIGATVGSVIRPDARSFRRRSGWTWGCGMSAAQLSLTARDLPTSLRANPLRDRSRGAGGLPDAFALEGPRRTPREGGASIPAGPCPDRRAQSAHRHYAEGFRHDLWCGQLGTLGGGNHFIEVCLDESQAVWVMLHSGSRGHRQDVSAGISSSARGAKWSGATCTFPTATSHGSTKARPPSTSTSRPWAGRQDYALANRREMMRAVLGAIAPHVPPFEVVGEAVECHHNYVARETHFGEELLITRKGAIRAGLGEMGIIPGSMARAHSSCAARALADSLCSSAHGAGRRMSRTQAKSHFSQRRPRAPDRGRSSAARTRP